MMTTGPDHFRHAEELADEADRRLEHMDWDAAVAWAAAAQVHATLAHAAATALHGDSLIDTQAWREAAAGDKAGRHIVQPIGSQPEGTPGGKAGGAFRVPGE